MNKNIFVIGTALLATTLLFSCSKEQAEETLNHETSNPETAARPSGWGANWIIASNYGWCLRLPATCYDPIVVRPNYNDILMANFDESIKDGPSGTKDFFTSIDNTEDVYKLMPGWDEDFFNENKIMILSGEYTFKKMNTEKDGYSLYLLGTPTQLEKNQSIAQFQFSTK